MICSKCGYRNDFLADLNRLTAQRDKLLAALEYYAQEIIYFPRSIVLECQDKGIRLAEIYSEFGNKAREAIKEVEGQ